MSTLNEERLLAQEKLLSRRELDPTHGCWVWVGAWNQRGHGVVRWGQRVVTVHALAAFAFLGATITSHPPRTLMVVHIPPCQTPACFNPQHLAVCRSQREASLAGGSFRRCGAKNGNATIDEQTARLIKQALRQGGETYQQIARRCHGTPRIVAMIAKQITWNHVVLDN